jgi:hypothetical protein
MKDSLVYRRFHKVRRHIVWYDKFSRLLHRGFIEVFTFLNSFSEVTYEVILIGFTYNSLV